MPGTTPIEVFFSYSHADEGLRDELAKQLKLLQRQGVISTWYDREIGAGEEFAGQIDRHLESARIILLLVSPDFLASDYCWDIETKRALERHKAGEARVIPIILRPCDWKNSPLKDLLARPTDGKPITTWANRDEAFLDVVTGIRKVAQDLAAQSPAQPSAGGSPAVSASGPTTAPASRPAAVSSGPPGAGVDPVRLYEVLDTRFSLDELQDLCFGLGLEWEDLAGGTRGAKARELISFLRRRGRLDALIDAIRRSRPDVGI